jgi:hypothetical protein
VWESQTIQLKYCEEDAKNAYECFFLASSADESFRPSGKSKAFFYHWHLTTLLCRRESRCWKRACTGGTMQKGLNLPFLHCRTWWDGLSGGALRCQAASSQKVLVLCLKKLSSVHERHAQNGPTLHNYFSLTFFAIRNYTLNWLNFNYRLVYWHFTRKIYMRHDFAALLLLLGGKLYANERLQSKRNAVELGLRVLAGALHASVK